MVLHLIKRRVNSKVKVSIFPITKLIKRETGKSNSTPHPRFGAKSPQAHQWIGRPGDIEFLILSSSATGDTFAVTRQDFSAMRERPVWLCRTVSLRDLNDRKAFAYPTDKVVRWCRSLKSRESTVSTPPMSV